MSFRQEDIKSLVREVVTRTLGESQPATQKMHASRRRPLLHADTVRHMPPNSVQAITPNTLVTPLANQIAMERRIRLAIESATPSVSEEPSPTEPLAKHRWAERDKRVVALGTDHGGYQLKEQLKAMLAAAESGYALIDCGTHSTDSVDYPDYAYAVARLVADGKAWRGIIIDGAGIGSCMTANKVPGVRAAMCYDQATAVNSREHNNANVLTLGAGLIGYNLAKQIVNTWLATEFSGGRHARRVDKIDQLDRRFARG